MQHTFESGDTMEYRPIQDLRAKDKDVVQAAVRFKMDVSPTGEIDLHDLELSGGLQTIQRNALMARVVKAWSFIDPDTELAIAVPTWSIDHIENEDAIGLLPIDAIIEIEALLDPYLEKVRRRPDPKGTTTAPSNGSSKGRAHASRRA